jgi:hypothetical protein
MRQLVILGLVCFAPLVSADDKAKPLTPAEAMKKVGEVCTVEFKVVTTGIPAKSPALLLVATDERSDKEFLVGLSEDVVKQLMAKEKKQFRELQTTLQGKTVRVTGKVTKRDTKRREVYEILVSEAKQLTVSEK